MDIKQIKAILIDLDGTLADSIPTLFQVYAEFMHQFELKASKEEFNSLIGPSLKEIVAKIKKDHHLNENIEILLNAYDKILMHHYTSKVKLFEGTNNFLSYAKNEGIKLAVVTSAHKRVSESFLNFANIKHYFDVLVSGDDISVSKPSPEIYEKALSALMIKASDAIAIEDSPNGVQAALNAHLRVLYFNPTKIVDSEHVIRVHSWKEIQKLFETQND
jgi:HAD superfamily hydrolase (TIGR01509 family)